MKMTDDNKLVNLILEYWGDCAYRDCVSDYMINKLVDDYALSCGIDERKLNSDVEITVRNMTNSQKRKLYKLMLESNIR